jgi:ABC-type antimicrobial peptide transport system permease subunit
MRTLKEALLSSALPKPLGKKSLSSGLTTALNFAQVALAVVSAFAAIAAVFGIPLSILVATHVIPAKALIGPHLGNSTNLAMWTVAIPYLLYAAVASRCALLIVRRLQSVFSSFVADQPFAPDNAVHLRAIWITLAVMEIARIVGFILMHVLTTAFAATENVTFPKNLEDPIDLVRLFLVFVVLILAEVFRQGTRLREETDLTV